MLSMPGPKFITPHEAKRVKTFHSVGYFVVWISIVWGFITLAQNVPSPLFIILEAIFLIGFFGFLSFLSRNPTIPNALILKICAIGCAIALGILALIVQLAYPSQHGLHAIMMIGLLSECVCVNYSLSVQSP